MDLSHRPVSSHSALVYSDATVVTSPQNSHLTRFPPRESGCAGAATSEPSHRVLCRTLGKSDRISARETAHFGTVATSDDCRRTSMWLEDGSGPATGSSCQNCPCLGGAAAPNAAS